MLTSFTKHGSPHCLELFLRCILRHDSLLHRSTPLHRGTCQTRLLILLLLLLCDSRPTLLSPLLTLRYFALLLRCWVPKMHRCHLLGWPRRWRSPRPIQRCSLLRRCRGFKVLGAFGLSCCVPGRIEPIIEQ